MRTKTKTLTAIALAAVLGGGALAGAGYAGHRGGGFDGRHGVDFLEDGPLGLSALEAFGAIDKDGDGRLSQAEIDTLRNERHAAHDANRDGNLSLEEFAGLWHETTRPITVPPSRCSTPMAMRSSPAPSTTGRLPISSCGSTATATAASRCPTTTTTRWDDD